MSTGKSENPEQIAYQFTVRILVCGFLHGLISSVLWAKKFPANTRCETNCGTSYFINLAVEDRNAALELTIS
ncbi:hypothetical protein PSSHI_33510 [Photobacterium sp. R1]